MQYAVTKHLSKLKELCSNVSEMLHNEDVLRPFSRQESCAEATNNDYGS